MISLPDDTYLFMTVFLVGVLVGMLAGMYLIAFVIDKIHKRPKVRHNDDYDPADWWKRGENPPWAHEED